MFDFLFFIFPAIISFDVSTTALIENIDNNSTMERFIKDGSRLRHHMAVLSKFISDSDTENAALNGTNSPSTKNNGTHESV